LPSTSGPSATEVGPLPLTVSLGLGDVVW
jgi:hypothetical protein